MPYPQEKHMAPIDCTGVPCSAGLKWFCKHCCSVHRDKVCSLTLKLFKIIKMVWLQLECRYYHHYHNPVITVPNTNKPDGLPQILESVNGGVFCKESGVFIYFSQRSIYASPEKLYCFQQLLLFTILGSHQ